MSMTVGELRKALEDQPDDLLVVMARDAEGNSHGPLALVERAMYVAKCTWAGDVYCTPEELAERMAEPGSGWTEEDAAPDDAVPIVLLGPV